MTDSEVLLERLNDFPKTYFFRKDIEKFHPGKKGNLSVLLNRMARKKKITRLMRSLYVLNVPATDWESLACELVKPSYISLEYALWRYGLINEIPARITLVTTGKSRLYTFPNTVLEYTHINSARFFGYTVERNALLAAREKAFLDELYLVGLKKRSLNLLKIEPASLDRKLLEAWGKRYPSCTRKLLGRILNRGRAG